MGEGDRLREYCVGEGETVPIGVAIERAALALAREPGWNGAEHDANEAARRIFHAAVPLSGGTEPS